MWLRAFCISTALVCVVLADQNPCSDAEIKRAEEEAVTLRSWDAIYRSYRRYARCNDVDAAEGYSESVARTLVDHWRTLPRLAALASTDHAFRRFVLAGVNATLDMKDVEKIRLNAQSKCPTEAQSLCAGLIKNATEALHEDASAKRQK
jgi:hypothetical protein